MIKVQRTALFVSLFVSLTACQQAESPTKAVDSDQHADVAAADEHGYSAPSKTTLARQKAVLALLPFADQSDFEEAQRGLIASVENLQIKSSEGTTIWDQPAYDFVRGDAPASVNPSLWRQAKLNNIHGLFKVSEGIYQLRGFDLANMTIIEGKDGWIVVDPLTSTETGFVAMQFAQQQLGSRPISAILFTHSHVDHFAGVLGVLAASETAIEDVQVIAPRGFVDESISENVLAGPTMARRSDYTLIPI